MPQIINTNIASLNAQRNLNKSQSANQTALQRLSSGLRINSAKDDAAGLAISTRFNSQIKGLNVAVRNAGDGISLAQTAEGALGSMNDNLQRIRELAVQSANATNSDVDREALQAEVTQLVAEISRTADETDFNGRKLLDGSFKATFQIGANAGQTLDVSIEQLTADKLGAAATAGVTAIGNSNALSNGDLIINGVAITASKAGDDTSSTSNAAASAIAKVEAINRHYDETGVKAYVNENVVSGSEMTGTAATGSITLNGVDINITTTTSTSQTRAAVVDAINAVAEQTGVMAVNSDSDTGGVQLVAKDGRNVELSFNTISAAGTGLAAAGTYEGGYTLVADGDVGKIEIAGGNGTGRGDLANAGLVKGTYSRGTAATVSEVQQNTTSATTVTGGSLANTIDNADDNATLIGGSLANTVVTSAAAASAVSQFHNMNVRVLTAGGSATTNVTIPSATSLNTVVSALNAVAGVSAFERIDFNITEFNSVTGGSKLYLANQTIVLPDDALADYDTVTERMTYLTNAINSTTFSAGITVTAELNAAKNSVSIRIDNFNSAGFLSIGVSTGATITEDLGGAALVAGSAGTDQPIIGKIAFRAASGVSAVDVKFAESTAALAASGELYTGKSYTGSSVGRQALMSSGTNEVNVSIGGVAQSSLTVDSGSTVNDLASAINNAYSDVNAWEEITLTFTGSNLEVGDTIYFGDGSDVTATGVGVAVSGTSLSQIADDINKTDFSAENIDIAAEMNAAGTEMTIKIRNYSGNELQSIVDGSGRSLQTATDLIGSKQQALSGVLAYASQSGEEVKITLADPTVGGEFYASNSSNTTFSGVNGLEDGDILINGVSIGGAKTQADTASAEYASDGTKILSSSKSLSAIAVAASINDVADSTGVKATVNATEVVGGDGTNVAGSLAQFEVGDAGEIFINGYSAGTVTLQADGSGAIDTDRAKADALALINSISGKTGVTAVDNGVSLTMTAADGRNISIAIDDKSGANASIGALFGMDAAVDGIGESTFGDTPAAANNGISAESATYETTYGTIRLESAGSFTVEAGADGADELNALGLKEGSYGGAEDGQFLTEIDISTFEGAQAALTAVDNAIASVASQRANLGAIQNRMDSTVKNLAITSENLSAANSRIQDADFAAETAELSRTQVLQQAGISILAQANQGPQQVLSLLQ